MVLIDAIYINNGGGKILLDFLILQLKNSNVNVYFLLDDRIIGKHPEINPYKVTYLRGNFVKRHFFYLKNKHRFSKVLCLGNLPPNIKLNAEVFTYFHQLIYLSIPKEFSLFEQFKFQLKIAILKQISKNTDYWMVQSNVIKEKLQSKFHFKPETIKILPFYPQFEFSASTVSREKNTYLYVSNATPHKNHKKLINAFCKFYDRFKGGKLILTVNNDYPEVLELIRNKINEGYPIVNIGFVDRMTLQKEYLSSEYLIFPSLAESFGLGLIEAIECGCKVIGADLLYTYEVCNPTLSFNPLEENSILRAFEESFDSLNLKETQPKITNKIEEIINLLKNENTK